MSFKVTPDHGYVILSTAAMSFYSLLNGALYIGRSRIFNKEWAEKEGKALRDEHNAALGASIKFSNSGYPDMGNGRYAATLSYKSWYDFNNQQRAHYNLIENFAGASASSPIALAPVRKRAQSATPSRARGPTHPLRAIISPQLPLTLTPNPLMCVCVGALSLQVLAGLFFPRVSSGLAVLWIGARHIWATNYIKGGPENRYGGLAGLHIVSVLGWLGMAVAGGLKLAGVVTY